jgi:hypothetical protein
MKEKVKYMKLWGKKQNPEGVEIPAGIQEQIRRRIIEHAEKNYKGRFTNIDIRFRGQFCYIDVYTEPNVSENFNEKLYKETRQEHIERLKNLPTHLWRLTYSGDENKWSLAFYKYSNGDYKQHNSKNDTICGTPEEKFDIGAVYL